MSHKSGSAKLPDVHHYRYRSASSAALSSASGEHNFFQDRDDVRSHGRDERILVKSFYEGQTFLCEFVKALSP
jgi:hypothetical protein